MEKFQTSDIPKSPRIQKLVDALYEHMPVIESARAKLITESYKETEGEPIITRRAKAFAHILHNIPIIIRDNELIVGSSTIAPRGCQTFPEFSYEWLEAELDTVATRTADPFEIAEETKAELKANPFTIPIILPITKVLVVDETTTALGQKGREELFKVMHKVRDTGNCVIFISHDLEEVIEQSDNISVLRDGVKIGSITKEEATPDRLKALMVGREIGDSYYRTDYGEKVSDEVVLSAKNVTVKGQIENLNLDLHKGEILGIGGLSECGMHEVGKALFGASYFRQGSVTLGDGTPINSIPDAIKHDRT